MKYLFLIWLTLVSFSILGQTRDHGSQLSKDTTNMPGLRIQIPQVDLSEIEVDAYGTPGQLKAASGSVSVIPQSRLENSSINIASSLTSVPGAIMQEGSPGTMKLTLRGIGSRYPYGTKKIKLFFGDIPMYSAENETTFDDINPEYIGRIEVLRGPASSLYGSSLGGTVILHPSKPAYNGSEYKLAGSAGSFGYFKNAITYSNGSPQSNLMLSVSGIENNGYRQNSQYSRYSFFINHQQVFNSRFTGNLIVSGSRIRAQIPSSIDSVTLVTNPKKAGSSWLKTKGYEHPDRIYAGYNLHYKTIRDWDYSASAYFNSRKTEENRPFNFLNEDDLAYGGRILTQHLRKLGFTTLKFSAGTNLFLENIQSSLSANPGGKGIKGNMLSDGRESLWQTDIFTQLEVQYRKITITGGINFNSSGFRFTDLTPDTLNQSGKYNFKPIWAPRISLMWNALHDLYIYASVNKGFSVPSLSETLSPLGLINRDIKPEKAWCFEGGSRLTLFDRKTFLDLVYYYMRVTDLIVPKRVAEEVYVGMNAGSSLHRGLEIAVDQWLVGNPGSESGKNTSLRGNINYALNRFNFQDFEAENINYKGKKLPGMPDQILSGSLDLKLPSGFYSRFEVNTSGRVPIDDLNNLYSKRWVVMNLKSGYAFNISKQLFVDAELKVNNIADEKYASMVVVNAPATATLAPRFFYPGLPRWFMCSVIISWNNSKSPSGK